MSWGNLLLKLIMQKESFLHYPQAKKHHQIRMTIVTDLFYICSQIK